VFVLSRVTLGADVAVTSVILDAVRQRFPGADIHFVGQRKNWELFAQSGILHTPFDYPRSGSIAARLSRIPDLFASDSIVVDPDSRLTQLGILPVCNEADYFFFESRAYGGDGNDALPVLASRWAEQVFGTEGRSWIAPEPAAMPCDVAVSFGVGDNEEKRISDLFEEELLRHLVERGLSAIVDSGAGGQESDRIESLRSRIPQVRTFRGPYAPFASMISQAKLYIGYDSAGQHVAAACGVPLLSIFTGYPSERMFQRWRPYGRGQAEVIQVRKCDSAAVAAQAAAAIDKLMFERGGQ
jgi:ADP-heptose:LPS heptosyltransferase